MVISSTGSVTPTNGKAPGISVSRVSNRPKLMHGTTSANSAVAMTPNAGMMTNTHGHNLCVLVTGSRKWTDRTVIRAALIQVPLRWQVRPAAVVVRHGAQGTYRKRNGILVLVKGADMMADEEATALGMRIDPMPADWFGPCRPECHHGPRRRNRAGRDYCQMAGMYRNQDMVDTEPKPTVTLAFPIGRSPGTRDCMRRAELAGILIIPLGRRAA